MYECVVVETTVRPNQVRPYMKSASFWARR